MTIPKLFTQKVKTIFHSGGEGSGFKGHAGRLGLVGGSTSETKSKVKIDKGVEDKFNEFKKNAKLRSKRLTAEEFGRNIWGDFNDEDSGLHCTFDSIKVKDGHIVFSGTVEDSNEHYSGHWTRELDPMSGEVYNDLFSLDLDQQGKGFGGKFYAHAEEQMLKYHVTKVKLFADLDKGGYAWARMGFDFEDDYSIGKHSEGFAISWEKAYGEDIPLPYGKTIFSSWEIASAVGPDGRKIGKEYLLGESWDGVKILDTNSRGFQIGETYYKSKGYK